MFKKSYSILGQAYICYLFFKLKTTKSMRFFLEKNILDKVYKNIHISNFEMFYLDTNLSLKHLGKMCKKRFKSGGTQYTHLQM